MTSNLPAYLAAEDAKRRRNVTALTALLARDVDLADICAWFIRANGIEGQLDAGYGPAAAYERIHALAGYLWNGRVATHGLRANDEIAVVEALGTVDAGAPVRFWTHVPTHLLNGQEVTR